MRTENNRNEKTNVRSWSREEDEAILNKENSNIELANRFGRTEHAIRTRRYNLRKKAGLPNVQKTWTEDEDELIFNSNYTTKELAKTLNKTTQAINSRRSALRGKNGTKREAAKRWTNKEDKVVLNLSLTNKQVAEKLNRPIAGVRLRRKALCDAKGIVRNDSKTYWDENEIAFLKANFNMPTKDLEKALNKSTSSILMKKSRIKKEMGLKVNERNAWTKKEDNLVLEHKYTDEELSHIIPHTKQSISQRRHVLKNVANSR